VLFLDLDDFKPVNDTHGHEVGDEVLQQAAHRIVGATRETDLVARQGGDEFLVLLADIDVGSDGDAAIGVAEDVRLRVAAAIAEPIEVSNRRLSIRASIGRAVFPFQAGNARSLLRLADDDMYARKREHAREAEIRRMA
jgi:diguanylate cyclase (GGDEF)-like protein